MITINDKGEVYYLGKEGKEAFLAPCGVECNEKLFLTKDQLKDYPDLWNLCLICQYFVPLDLFNEEH